MTPFSERDSTDDIWWVGYAWADVRLGSRLCENVDIETSCATIESGR